MLPWIVAAVTLIVLLASMVAATRAQRQLTAAHEEAVATKNEQISALESQLTSLRESESIRFVDRYVAAKNGLEERLRGLHDEMDAAREQQDHIRGELTDLGLSDRERESEVERLRRDLVLTNDQIRRLEVALREVASVGPLDVNAIRVEMDDRRELAAHIKDRLDRLSLESRDRVAGRLSRTHRLERLDQEVGRIRREIEITRAAASIVDGVLGIDTDTRKRLARHASDRIEGALQSLGDAARRSPIARFVDVLEKQRPDRLLERGRTAEQESAGDPHVSHTMFRPETERPRPETERPRPGTDPGERAESAAPSEPRGHETGVEGEPWIVRESHRSPAV
jgi:predicted  nucleic acid-binding Zn-ribbon protein